MSSTPPGSTLGFSTASELRSVISADLFRYWGARGIRGFAKTAVGQPGFACTLFMRLASFTTARRSKPVWTIPHLLALTGLWCSRHAFGISLSPAARIGPGFYISHFGGIVIHRDAVLGRNCNVSQGVTIGLSHRGPRQGTPVIGDEVFIGPGAVIVGDVRIGDRAAIGANVVITKDVEADAVVVGPEPRVISHAGSLEYAKYTDY
jgi:serine O-acetyltransferase